MTEPLAGPPSFEGPVPPEGEAAGSLSAAMSPGILSWRVWLRSCLLCLAIALPVAFYLRTYDSAMIKIILLQLGTAAALTIWIFGCLSEGRVEIPAEVLPSAAPAALLLAWNAVRFALAAHPGARSFSVHPWAALDGFVKQEAFLLAFLSAQVSFSRRDARLAILFILGGWLITVLYGTLQWFDHFWGPGAGQGIDPFIWRGAFGERVFSTLGNPNFFASFLQLCAPLALALSLDGALPRALRLGTGAAAVVGALTLAWTRSPLEIGLFAASMAVFGSLAAAVLRNRRRTAALALSGLCAAVCLGASSPSLRRGEFLSKDVTFRAETWKGTQELIKTQPMLGSGPGSFWVRYPAFRRPGVILLEHRHNAETDHAENEFLEQWAEGGIVAPLLWLWLFGAVLYGGWSTIFDSGPDGETAGYAVGIFTAVAVSVLSMLISTAARFVAPGWFMYLVAGLLGALRRDESKPEVVAAFPLPARGAWPILFMPILAGAVWLAWSSVRMFRSDIDHNIAIYYSKQRDWDKALLHYDAEVPGAPAYIMGQYFKGNVLQDRGGRENLERAVAQYRYVRSLAPDYVQVHYQEGAALRKLGRREEALERFEAETKIDPVWDSPWHQLSELYLESGRPEKAASAAREEARARELWEGRTVSTEAVP